MLKDTYTLGKEEWGIKLATFRLLNDSSTSCTTVRGLQIHISNFRGKGVCYIRRIRDIPIDENGAVPLQSAVCESVWNNCSGTTKLGIETDADCSDGVTVVTLRPGLVFPRLLPLEGTGSDSR